jgi:nucleoside-diphosphate-sugar epimerase
VSPGTNDLIRDLILGKVPMLLPGGFPVVFARDCALGHILAAEKAKSGDRFILSDSYFSLLDFAKLVSLVYPLKKIPSVMPLWLAKLFSASGELKAKVFHSAPMLPAGQLHFLQWQAIPVAQKAIRDLGWKVTDTKEGIQQTIEFLGLLKN